MGTFFTSKHGLGSRGPGGTPPSKPKSSTPPGAHGIDDKVLRWLEAWLADRKQQVVVQGAESGWRNVTSSVVQGSVLARCAFLCTWTIWNAE